MPLVPLFLFPCSHWISVKNIYIRPAADVKLYHIYSKLFYRFKNKRFRLKNYRIFFNISEV